MEQAEPPLWQAVGTVDPALLCSHYFHSFPFLGLYAGLELSFDLSHQNQNLGVDVTLTYSIYQLILLPMHDSGKILEPPYSTYPKIMNI